MNCIASRLIIVLMAAALALPVMAQFTTAQEPIAQFQSTSSMQYSGSMYASCPSLNADGIAAFNEASYEQSQQSSGPRKISPVTPEGNPTPVGDDELPLMLMAALTVCVIYRRQNK